MLLRRMQLAHLLSGHSVSVQFRSRIQKDLKRLGAAVLILTGKMLAEGPM